MHCDMLKIQNGVAIVEKLNYQLAADVRYQYSSEDIVNKSNCIMQYGKNSLLFNPPTPPLPPRLDAHLIFCTLSMKTVYHIQETLTIETLTIDSVHIVVQ